MQKFFHPTPVELYGILNWLLNAAAATTIHSVIGCEYFLRDLVVTTYDDLSQSYCSMGYLENSFYYRKIEGEIVFFFTIGNSRGNSRGDSKALMVAENDKNFLTVDRKLSRVEHCGWPIEKYKGLFPLVA